VAVAASAGGDDDAAVLAMAAFRAGNHVLPGERPIGRGRRAAVDAPAAAEAALDFLLERRVAGVARVGRAASHLGLHRCGWDRAAAAAGSGAAPPRIEEVRETGSALPRRPAVRRPPLPRPLRGDGEPSSVRLRPPFAAAPALPAGLAGRRRQEPRRPVPPRRVLVRSLASASPGRADGRPERGVAGRNGGDGGGNRGRGREVVFAGGEPLHLVSRRRCSAPAGGRREPALPGTTSGAPPRLSSFSCAARRAAAGRWRRRFPHRPSMLLSYEARLDLARRVAAPCPTPTAVLA
jgi:hypothetical protein